ncbi:MAG: GTPase Era [Candidatus Magasanikbacteria bacterium]|nr:GTPase Era [Candidatus Magasanikbacteria bacterium]
MNSPENQLKKSGLVTLVGRSNVGKSTLLNTIIGTKIAAVTDKPQTTRNAIHGVLNRPASPAGGPEGQAVFIDTPGVFKNHSSPLSGALLEHVQESIKHIDLIVYVVDPTKPIGSEERYIMSLIRNIEVPKILVINKSDIHEKEKEFLEDYKSLGDDFAAVFELSALRARHIEPLIQKVLELLPVGEPLYPPDQLTNIDKNFWVAELIREKIFLALRKEVPYSTHVEVENIEDKTDIFVVKARVLTYNKKYKEMIIGKGGRAIKEIGIAARKELEQALGKKVYLELEVEYDRHWIDRVA